jgi:hypothetical protein
MKKQITIFALACMALALPAATGLMNASAQETRITTQPDVNDFRINHISSSETASTFSVRFSDAQLKNHSLRIYNEKGDELYKENISKGYAVFKVLTEEPAGTLTFALFNGKRKISTHTWQISTVNETRIIATESK